MQERKTGGRCGWPSATTPSCTGSMPLSISLATRSAHMACHLGTRIVHSEQSCRQVSVLISLYAIEI